MSARTARELVMAALREIYEPRVAPPVRQWVEGLRIPVKKTHNSAAAEAGKTWEFSDFPVMADWVFDFLENEETEVLFKDGSRRKVRNRTAAVMKDVQSGMTSVMIHALAWWLHWKGGNVIMVTATRDMARDAGKDKTDILDDYPMLRWQKLESSTTMALRYPRSIVWLGGGQSIGPVISNPASLVICDEVAKHEMVKGMIPMALLEGRITGDDSARMISFSTPDNELEFTRNQYTGRDEPVVTVETAIHSSYLQGTQEVVEVPCPHCGHYQVLDWQRLRFDHCKESLPGMDKPIWNFARVVKETWYQCANTECEDRHPDGSVRGMIEEKHKRWMIERRRYVAQNLEHRSSHRTLQAGGMYNLAFRDRSWGSIAENFLTAVREGGEAAMKSFMTDKVGIPFSRFKAKDDSLDHVRRLRRRYRRTVAGRLTLKIPMSTEQIRLIGMTADVQRTPGMEVGEIGAVKWLIFAASKTGEISVLDWGSAPGLDSLVDLVESRVYCSEDEAVHHLTIDVVMVDTGYAMEKVQMFLCAEGGSRSMPRWCGFRGGARENSQALRGRPRLTKEFPGRTKLNAETVLRVVNARIEHYEHELHIERVAKEVAGSRTAPAINLPADADDEFLAEISNIKQVWERPNNAGVRVLRWKKARPDDPNDHADNLRNALVLLEAAEEEMTTRIPQL